MKTSVRSLKGKGDADICHMYDRDDISPLFYDDEQDKHWVWLTSDEQGEDYDCKLGL